MHPIIILLAVGAGYLAFKSPSASSSTSNLTAQQTAAAQAANASALNANAATMAAAQTFDAQANALGLTQTQAQTAYDIGLTPQEYLDSGMSSATTSGWGGAPHNLLENFDDTGMEDATTGAPILSDAMGNLYALGQDGNPYLYATAA